MTQQKLIAFDCDGTLIGRRDEPRQEIVDMLKGYQKVGYSVIVWSGGGKSYAQMVGSRIKLEGVTYMGKLENPGFKPDIAVDDMDVELGVINIRV